MFARARRSFKQPDSDRTRQIGRIVSADPLQIDLRDERIDGQSVRLRLTPQPLTPVTNPAKMARSRKAKRKAGKKVRRKAKTRVMATPRGRPTRAAKSTRMAAPI